jgi:hypothetical protein
VARGCGSHCAVEALAKELCSGCMPHGAEEVVVEASLSALQVPTGMVLARDCGYFPVAVGTEKETVPDRMRGTETMVLAKVLASAVVGTMAPERQLESGHPGAGTMVRETRRANTADSSSVARVRLPYSHHDTAAGVLGRQPSVHHSTAEGALERQLSARRNIAAEGLARQPGSRHGTVLEAQVKQPCSLLDTASGVRATRLCIRHGTVAEAPAMAPADSCTAALAVLATLP